MNELKKAFPLIPRALAFLLPLLLVLTLLSVLFEPKDNSAQAGMENMRTETANGILAEPENTIDVLIVGDSETYSAFSPLQMWEEQGFTSYVCGTHAQSLMQSYAFVEKALRTQSPRTVILETNAIFRRMYPQQVIFNAVANHFGIFRYHDRWKSLSTADFTQRPRYTTVSDTKGFVIRHKTVAVKEEKQEAHMIYAKGKRRIRKWSQWYLAKIRRLCQDRGCQLILVSSPSTKNWNFKKHNCINQYAKQHAITYLDMNLSIEEMDINWNEDSMDGGDHLNLKGAQKATAFLGFWLKNELKLPDHRTEESYQLWNAQLEKYHKLIEDNTTKGSLSLTQGATELANQVLKTSGFSQVQNSAF